MKRASKRGRHLRRLRQATSPPAPLWYMGRLPALAGLAPCACDFLEAATLSGARVCVLAVTGHRARRIRILGATAYPAASWVAQAARNLVMNLEEAGCRARFLIRDRTASSPRSSTPSWPMQASRSS